MPEPAARPGPGRPPSGARERVLDAGLEVLKRDGYAGLTTAKVAARSGQNKALISYHFGSKEGLVAAVAREVSDAITAELLGSVGDPRSTDELVRSLVAGLWRILERDQGLQRVYFDLASQSVVEPRVRDVMREMKQAHRSVLRDFLVALPDGPGRRGAEAAAVYLIAGLEGLALEHLERGDTPALRRARELFARTAPAALAG